MSQIDAALVIDLVGGHVLQANLIVDAAAGAAHAGDDKHAWPNGGGHVGANADDLPKVFVAGDEEVGPLRRLPILGLVDFAVSAIDAHAQHLDQYAAPAWDARQVWLRHVFQVHRVRLAWIDRYRLHVFLPFRDVCF